MCMAKAYLEAREEGSEQELLMEDVTRVEVENGVVRLATLFGDTREVAAVIKEIDLQDGNIVLATLQ